jgi:RHS repeat-associated protein
VVTNYAYDDLNRLTTITYPTRTVTYNYDPLNNLTRAINENGTVYINYDNRYRINSVSDPFFYGIGYTYDAVGNRTALKVNGATYATYTYDAANRLTSRSAPNGVTSSYGYDDMNRLTSLMHTNGSTTLSGNLYTYNNANNFSSWTTQTSQKAYTYDAVDRLTSVSNFEAPAENYSYDAVGNRTASQLSATYGYQPFNKLTNTSSATYGYDNNGNVVSKTDSLGAWTFTYDEENRLTQVEVPSGPTVNYKYDGLGRRIQRTTSIGANERYVYDRADVLIDLNADWSVATTYLNGAGLDNHLRQTNSATGISYYLADHLGSTTALVDSGGDVIESQTYDSFGNTSGSARTRYGYTGRERDAQTGMSYYRARYYDPGIGRFMSEDPITFKADINFYAYTRNNPVSNIDPSGLEIEPANGIPRVRPVVPPPAYPDNYDWWGHFRRDLLVTRQDCRPPRSWGGRWVDSFWETNAAIPGLTAPALGPIGLGSLTSAATASALGTQTPMQWAASGFGGSIMGAGEFTAAETGIVVGGAALINFTYVSIAWEGGVAIGAAINASVPRRCDCK